jgi:hypothetical protein
LTIVKTGFIKNKILFNNFCILEDQKMKKIKLGGILFVFMVLITGCATNYTPLDLNYTATENLEKKDVKVALIKPVYSAGQQASQAVSSSPYAGLMARMLPPDFKLKAKYNTDYVINLRNAMQTSMESILLSKGFNVAKTFDSVDEVSYSYKKDIDLLIEPEFDFGPVIRNKRTNIPVVGPVDKGTIQMTGKIKIVFTEPMSRETILIKNIDISSLGFANSIEYSDGKEAENSLVIMLNQMYPELMDKIEGVIHADEVMNSLEDVKRLKEKEM